MLLIYTSYSSPRVEYIFSTLLTALGNSECTVTTDIAAFKRFYGAKINYSKQAVTKEEIWITPAKLLFENTIAEQEISCFQFNDAKAFYKTSGGDFPFDIFAASFYLLTRYEEYLPYKEDMYGRYAHENSLAFKEQFLHLPLVNLWLQEFRKVLTRKFPSITLTATVFTFLPTYDIDIAFSYLYKGVLRNLGGFIKSMWDSEWTFVRERLDVLFKKKKDPFDSYEELDRLHNNYKLAPLYFFLLAARNKDYDKNILPKKRALKTLVQQLSKKHEVGIHPSWQSGDKQKLLKQEIDVLQKLSGKEVLKSRQHYIRMQLPATYRNLLNAGIKEDYSMGYGSINGFRASFCLPYIWYDLEKEETTNLTIYPFCYMDANSFYEQQFNAEEALQEMMHYYDTVKQVDGLFITIWHNQFLGADRIFSGWKEAYRELIEEIAKDEK
ncbi:MAG TPA: polysaccharide deacetylase family protein [Segetibacter sp.]|nr:polysaccharide deacetylase family protein [Segetibacter sp.]